MDLIRNYIKHTNIFLYLIIYIYKQTKKNKLKKIMIFNILVKRRKKNVKKEKNFLKDFSY